jgi:hypothetical protein
LLLLVPPNRARPSFLPRSFPFVFLLLNIVVVFFKLMNDHSTHGCHLRGLLDSPIIITAIEFPIQKCPQSIGRKLQEMMFAKQLTAGSVLFYGVGGAGVIIGSKDLIGQRSLSSDHNLPSFLLLFLCCSK